MKTTATTVEVTIDLRAQALVLREPSGVQYRYAVSTAANGPGQLQDSECTPLGRHIIRAKIGAGCPLNTVFRGRRPTGEIYQATGQSHAPNRDWILTRILWLSGCEPGFNRLGNVDTMRRYIYLHGTPDSVPMGAPDSHGCIRMHNEDLLQLFAQVQPGTPVLIHA